MLTGALWLALGLPPHGLQMPFAAYTGLRIRDVDLRSGHIEVRQTLQRIAGEWRVETPKSARSTRTVPLLDRRHLGELREYVFALPHRANPDALLWPGPMPDTRLVDFSRVFEAGLSDATTCGRP